jgi:hypothetical protein
MKRTLRAKKIDLDPIEKRRDWIMFAGYARMHVSVSGGPIHDPHQEVLQLMIEPWKGDYESWTVYRHGNDPKKAGKIVFKKWNREADKARFHGLGHKEAPKEWIGTDAITEQQIPVPGRWVSSLERRLDTLRIPPIAGIVRPFSSADPLRLRLWRESQQSEFQWQQNPPRAWEPISRLFNSLLRTFRDHITGKPLTPIRDL